MKTELCFRTPLLSKSTSALFLVIVQTQWKPNHRHHDTNVQPPSPPPLITTTSSIVFATPVAFTVLVTSSSTSLPQPQPLFPCFGAQLTTSFPTNLATAPLFPPSFTSADGITSKNSTMMPLLLNFLRYSCLLLMPSLQYATSVTSASGNLCHFCCYHYGPFCFTTTENSCFNLHPYHYKNHCNCHNHYNHL
jgi:hypothetical protein